MTRSFQRLQQVSEQLIRRRFKNAIFEISPSETVGVFDVKAKFMGVLLETVQLEYQVQMVPGASCGSEGGGTHACLCPTGPAAAAV